MFSFSIAAAASAQAFVGMVATPDRNAMKLQMLKPRISTIDTRKVKELAANPMATPRTRGRAWMRTRAKWLSAHPLCIMCEQHGRITAATEVDHIIPLVEGGKDDDTNYQSLCYAHHKDKTAEEAKGRARW